MPVTRENMFAHELTGLHVTVTGSTDLTQLGMTGIVIDETRNMLSVLAEENAVHVPKDISKFTFTLPNGESVTAQGTRLRLRPEDRVKRGVGVWR